MLKAYGAELILTPGEEGMKGAIAKANELVREHNGFMPQQVRNPANPEIHHRSTAREILAQAGQFDAFVAGIGTRGTITGVGDVLREERTDVLIVAVEPVGSRVLSGGSPGKHKTQGISAGLTPEVLNTQVIDEIIQVSDNTAWETTRRPAREEGILCGMSSGAAAWAAMQIAKRLGAGKAVITVLPDTGERYLSTGLFD